MKSQYLFIIIFLTAVAILGFFLVLPKYQKLETAQVNIEAAEAKIASREEYLLDLKNLNKKVGEYEYELKIIDSALLDEPWPSHLFDYLSSLALENGLVMSQPSFSIESSSKEDKFKENKTTISLLGSYSSLKKFLTDIENSGKLFNVHKISFSSQNGEPFSFDLILSTKSY